MNNSAGHFKSWRGLWNDYRVFLPTANSSFSGARPNAYLIYRLGWNIEDSLSNITDDFSALYFGSANTQAITDILYLTQDAYLNAQSTPRYVADWGVTWATVFNPVNERLADFAKYITYEELRSVNSQVENATDQMQSLQAAINASSLPNATIWTDFKLGLAKTRAHLLTLTTWREIYWLNATLAKGLSPANHSAVCQALDTCLSSWEHLMTFWTEQAPEEGSDWEITQPSPKLASRPDFFHAWVSFNDYIVKIQSSSSRACKSLRVKIA